MADKKAPPKSEKEAAKKAGPVLSGRVSSYTDLGRSDKGHRYQVSFVIEVPVDSVVVDKGDAITKHTARLKDQDLFHYTEEGFRGEGKTFEIKAKE